VSIGQFYKNERNELTEQMLQCMSCRKICTANDEWRVW